MAADEWAILTQAPLFKAIEPELRRSLLQNRSSRAYARGEQIFQQGDSADAFFLVAEGYVKLYRERERGEQIVVAIFAAGETFAEAAMFLGGHYPASAEAVTPARILRFDGNVLRRAILEKPELAFAMLAAASFHLKQLVEQIEQLKAQSAPQRIASFLLKQIKATSGPAKVILPYEKALIANRLGMKPESFSRALAKLRKLGVAVERGSAHIHDVGLLIKFTDMPRET